MEGSSHNVRLTVHCKADGTRVYISCIDTNPATTIGQTEVLQDTADRFCLAAWAGVRIIRTCLLGESPTGEPSLDRDQHVLDTYLVELVRRLGTATRMQISVATGQTSAHLQSMSELYPKAPFEIQVTTAENASVGPCVATWGDSTAVPDGWTDEQADDILLKLVAWHAWRDGEINTGIFDAQVERMLESEQDNAVESKDLVAVALAVRAAHNYFKKRTQQ